MRQWLVNPKILCKKHLLGEHCEHHMFVGTINKGKSVYGYIKNNLLEPGSLHKRHDELVEEMKNRGYNHKSNLPYINYRLLLPEYCFHKIDRDNSLNDLLNRCKKCRENYQK